MFSDIGIVGTGLWRGNAVSNEEIVTAQSVSAPIKDPFKGKRSDDGIVRIAGLELRETRYRRALAAIEKNYRDPFRGARRRRIFPDELKVIDAETEAARHAMLDAGLSSSAIDTVLVQSLLPDEILIKNATAICHNLGINAASAWNVDSVCTSALAQMQLAASLVMAGQARHVLCVQSVAYSRVVDRNSSLWLMIGDMASAYIVGKKEGSRLGFGWRTDGRLHNAIRYEWINQNPAHVRKYWEPSHERLTLFFDNQLQAEAMSELEGYALPVCREALARAEISLSEIDTFIPHQPLSWFPALMADMLGLSDGVSFDTFEEYASINASSVTASIHEARQVSRLKNGSKLLVFIPGGGYVYGAMAMRW